MLVGVGLLELEDRSVVPPDGGAGEQPLVEQARLGEHRPHPEQSAEAVADEPALADRMVGHDRWQYLVAHELVEDRGSTAVVGHEALHPATGWRRTGRVSHRARWRRYSPIDSSANPIPTTIASGASPDIDMILVASSTVPNVHGASMHTISGISSIRSCRTGNPVEIVCAVLLRSQTVVSVVVVQAISSH
ncbi:MAG: hypothetical protein R2710_30125 [Acidimicrobiales bacterium]